eukprot:scaffold371_cov36-Phaeocystis_antarctica.AAC.1
MKLDPRPGRDSRMPCAVLCYGERSRRTRLFRDQLWLADAGSWQIADRYYSGPGYDPSPPNGTWRCTAPAVSVPPAGGP